MKPLRTEKFGKEEILDAWVLPGLNAKRTKAYMKKHYGYTSFRPNQLNIMKALVKKNDVYVQMPTDGGKSMTITIPVMTEKSVAVIIYPIIALINDQFSQLN